MIETQFNRTVKIFWSNNAQEYNDKYFLSFLGSKGTLPYRALYGLKQAPRAWFEKFSSVVIRDDYAGICSLQHFLS